MMSTSIAIEKHAPARKFRLNLLALCALFLCSCSSIRTTTDTANPKPFEENTKTLAPERPDRSSYVAYALIGFPRDVLDIPFSSISMGEYLIGGPEGVVKIGGGTFFILCNAEQISHGYFAFDWAMAESFAVGGGAYIVWVLVGHPLEVLLLRYPYDDNWITPSSKRQFFPNYQGMFGENGHQENPESQSGQSGEAISSD